MKEPSISWQEVKKDLLKDPEFAEEVKKFKPKYKKLLPNILNNAPLDEEPLTKQEIKESEAAWQEYQEGKGKYLT